MEAFVPQLDLEWSELLRIKLRFVDLKQPGLEGLLVQEVEVAKELVFKLGLAPDPGVTKCLPWTDLNLEKAQGLVKRLNELVPADAGYRFLVPSVAQRQIVEAAPQFCTLQKPALGKAAPKTKDGYLPKTGRSTSKLVPVNVYSEELWHAGGGVGLFGFVGNVSELCIIEGAEDVDYRGGGLADRKRKSILASHSKITSSGFGDKASGLRLFVQLKVQ